MNELEEKHRLRANGCGCLLALIGCLLPIICFFIAIFLFFQSTFREVTNEKVIFESSSPNEIILFQLSKEVSVFMENICFI